jgi:hypothetical protein
LYPAVLPWGVIETTRKITVEVPLKLWERKKQRPTRAGITQTVCTGLRLVAASQAYSRLR